MTTNFFLAPNVRISLSGEPIEIENESFRGCVIDAATNW